MLKNAVLIGMHQNSEVVEIFLCRTQGCALKNLSVETADRNYARFFVVVLMQ